MSNIILGKYISNSILDNIKNEYINYLNIEEFKPPKVCIIQIGDNNNSNIYIKKKKETCDDLNFICEVHNYKENTELSTIIDIINQFNNNKDIHGIMIQLPIPITFDKKTILNTINPKKDIDCLTSYNFGKIIDNDSSSIIPCTPLACMEILKSENIQLPGKYVVIIGTSKIVGTPLALLLTNYQCTVTMCNNMTKDIKTHTLKADILIVACGSPNMIKKDWINQNCLIIDIGINHIPDPNKENKLILVGDVDFHDVKDIAYKITPVPGGIGSITVAMFVKNLFKCYCTTNSINQS
jgi:5,10-methylene-tetrahydrofolate dehydrogenase/methenyl tetrahydrofolate cyclohydrolase|tara:strand:+ start:2554 stop:3441 length:888 start_codon:yes stop_codon:yes gene_type:complete